MKRSEFVRKWLKDYTEENRTEMYDDLDSVLEPEFRLGYEQGWKDATGNAVKEIRKNYQLIK